MGVIGRFLLGGLESELDRLAFGNDGGADGEGGESLDGQGRVARRALGDVRRGQAVHLVKVQSSVEGALLGVRISVTIPKSSGKLTSNTIQTEELTDDGLMAGFDGEDRTGN